MESNRSRCWAIKGSKPIKSISGSKARINIGGFYTENKEFFWYDLGIKQNTDSFLKSLIKFNREIGVRIFLLLDRATWHRLKKAQEFFQKKQALVENNVFSSSYSRQEPTEYCWKVTREELTSIKSFKNVNVLKEGLEEFWKKHKFTHKMSHYLKW